jgi:hypothetical protein
LLALEFGIPNVRRLKSMITPNEFYVWNWIIRERQKAEAGDKTAFQMTDEEKITAFAKRKGLIDDNG